VDEIAADWIFEGGRVLTLDPRRPVAQALAVAGGRVVAVGGRAEVRRRRARGTRVVDVRGATIVPGLVDAHAHLAIANTRALARAGVTRDTTAPKGVEIQRDGSDATPQQLERIRRLGVMATTNPISYLWRSGATEAAKLGGAAERLLPHRSLARLGIPFGLATDNKPANLWRAFSAAVDRRDMASGEVLGAGERLTRAQALTALTIGGARLTLAERERGRLAPGYAADLAVLEHDPLTAPLEAVAEQRARLTMVGGEVVWNDA